MTPTAADADGSHPLERIAISLESIADSLHKIVNPPMRAIPNPVFKQGCDIR